MSWTSILLIFLIVVLGLTLAKYIWKQYMGGHAVRSCVGGGCDRPDCPCGPDCTCGPDCSCGLITTESDGKNKNGGDCGCGCGRNVVFISGVSGVGKSTVGKKVVERLNNKGVKAIYIDQDSYYSKKKPPITLSNRLTTANWDHEDAIDWDSFNEKVRSARKKNKCTVVVGFALWKDKIDETPDRHFLLEYPTSMSDNEIVDKIIETRRKAKNFKGHKIKRDELMVKEAVWPFYKKTLKKMGKHVNIPAFKFPDSRRHVEEIADDICREIETITPGVPPDKNM